MFLRYLLFVLFQGDNDLFQCRQDLRLLRLIEAPERLVENIPAALAKLIDKALAPGGARDRHGASIFGARAALDQELAYQPVGQLRDGRGGNTQFGGGGGAPRPAGGRASSSKHHTTTRT